MGKFQDELSSTKNQSIKKIGEYLSTREDIKDKLDNPKKSLEECLLFIASKYYENSIKVGKYNVNGDSDDAVYGLAVHYYDEENIKVDESILKNVKVESQNNNDNNNNIKKDVPNKVKKQKNKIAEGQLKLFDF